MKRQVPIVAVLAAATLIVAVVGYLALIKPKKDASAKLTSEVAALETELKQAELEARRAVEAQQAQGAQEEKIRVADLVKLAKAMPDDADMAGTLVELGAISSAAGVKFLSIQPLAPVVGTGYRRVPIQLTFDGNFYDLLEVLYDLRGQVRVREGRLQADGRLFTLDQFDLHESASGFPRIEALLTVSAFLHGTGDGTDLLGAAGLPAATIQPAPPAAPAAPAAPPAPAAPAAEPEAPPAQPAETIESDPNQAPSLPDESS